MYLCMRKCPEYMYCNDGNIPSRNCQYNDTKCDNKLSDITTWGTYVTNLTQHLGQNRGGGWGAKEEWEGRGGAGERGGGEV